MLITSKKLHYKIYRKETEERWRGEEGGGRGKDIVWQQEGASVSVYCKRTRGDRDVVRHAWSNRYGCGVWNSAESIEDRYGDSEGAQACSCNLDSRKVYCVKNI